MKALIQEYIESEKKGFRRQKECNIIYIDFFDSKDETKNRNNLLRFIPELKNTMIIESFSSRATEYLSRLHSEIKEGKQITYDFSINKVTSGRFSAKLIGGQMLIKIKF